MIRPSSRYAFNAVSLSLTWFEHDDGIRVDDSLGDEVEAYFGADAEILLDHQAFGASFQVNSAMLTEFEHSDREITSWTYSTYQLPLKQVLDVIASRRRILDSALEKLSNRLAIAVQRVVEHTRLSALAGDVLNSSLDFEEAIMIHYLNYALPRFDAETRIDPSFYRDGLRSFEEYLFTTHRPNQSLQPTASRRST